MLDSLPILKDDHHTDPIRSGLDEVDKSRVIQLFHILPVDRYYHIPCIAESTHK